ncbi:MAG: glycosyltransferase family 2 protein [Fibrobacterota bacterium]
MKISVVIPLFNENESLPELMSAIASVMKEVTEEYEVLFVDDGSTDDSFQTCRKLHLEFPLHVRVIRFSRNYGKAAALSAGIEKARGDVIITMDADLQDDPTAIPAMLDKLDEGYDLVSGWKKKRHDPILSKNIPSKVFNFVVSAMSGVHLHDFNCGFKAYREETAKSLDIYGERHRFLPALAHWDRWRVTEIPVTHHPRKFGKTKYGISRFFNGLLDLITLLFLRRYLTNPLHFFGLLGLFCFFVGAVVLGYFGVNWAITGQMHIRPLTLLSVGAIIVGIQFISIGLIGEMITNSNPNRTYKIRDFLE